MFCAELIHPFPEDAASHTDEGASLANSQRVVVAHAHGDFAELGIIFEMSFLHVVEKVC